MTITIKPFPFIMLLLAILVWLSKPAVASKPQSLSKAHGMTADEAIAIKDKRIERTFRSAYETAISR